MEIISVVESDWEQLKNIRLTALKDSPDAFAVLYETALNYSETEWRSRASGKNSCNYFIAKVDSLSVGVIGGVYRSGEYELISMWVSPSQRGKGISQLLINKVVEHAKILNKDYIFLEVTSNNTSACKVYEKCGFKLVSTNIPDLNDTTLNDTIKTLKRMQLSLTSKIFCMS